MRSAVLRELEQRVEALEAQPSGQSSQQAVAATGIPPLDALLPEGGLPRGQAIEWAGPRSCGKTALLRAALGRLHGMGEPVAMVDASRTLYAPDWTPLTGGEPFWVVRPPRENEALWCADLLLRSGAFGVVALETDAGLARNPVVRLQRLAEKTGAVFVVLGSLPLAALRLRFRPGRLEPVAGVFGPALPAVRPVWVDVGKGGSNEIPILCPSPAGRAVQPLMRDRKGPR